MVVTKAVGLLALCGLVTMTTGQSDQTGCCFPTQLEGTVQLFDQFTTGLLLNSQTCRFAADYAKGRVLVRHPDNDNVYQLQDLENGVVYHRLLNGVCLETPLKEKDRFFKCVPGDAVLANRTLQGPVPKGQTSWSVQRNATSPPTNETAETWITVTQAGCLPVAVHQFTSSQDFSKDHIYTNLNHSIEDPTILFPSLKDCVRPDRKCSAGANNSPSLFMTVLVPLLAFLNNVRSISLLKRE